MSNPPYALTLTGKKAEIFALADALGFEAPFSALSVSIFEHDEDSFYVQALYLSKADAKAACGVLNIAPNIMVEIKQLPDEDWVSKSQDGLAPQQAGQFLIYGSHDKETVDLSEHIGLQINAGMAFGSGHHGTTAGCLILFSRLLSQNIHPQNILDLGCGAGILSIAAAKSLQQTILATDIDQDAVDVTHQNAIINNVGNFINAHRVDGFQDPLFKGRQFDLIFANILAAPLMSLAEDILRHMDTGSYIILSGILSEQEITVANHFNSHGLDIIDTEPREEWVSLLGRKPRA